MATSPETSPVRPEKVVIQGRIIVPSPPARRVERGRLETRLAELIRSHRVVVIAATAGAGKTTAVAAAVRGLSVPVAWLTVDRTDVAPGRLLVYLEAALARALAPVQGVATGALASGIPHGEAAGLLAEAVGGAEMVLVLDEVERLGDSPEAWGVIEAFARYLTPAARLVLISRRAVPALVLSLPGHQAPPASVGEADLAFTPSEAAEALAQLGREEVDAASVVDATGGWVTGVLFEAWRSAGHVAGMGGEADPLHGYLSSHILGQLDPAEREFLELTSLLDEVTAERAEALGLEDAGRMLLALRTARLPVVWQREGRAMRCHSRFREYLIERLERRGSHGVRTLRIAYGHLLAGEGRFEDATEELLAAGAPEAALATAERSILDVIERLDFAVAARWLEGLAEVATGPATALTIAELMLAVGEADYRRGVRIADQLEALGEREPLARASGFAAALMAFLYAHACRPEEMHAVLDAAPDDPAVDALRYGMSILEPGPPAERPELSGGAMDAIVLASDYFLGRTAELVEDRGSRWLDSIAGSRTIGALRLLGRTQRALELYDAVRARGQAMSGLDATVSPELLIDAGRREEAHAAVRRGRSEAKASGSLYFEMFSRIMEAKVALRMERDPESARAVLDRLEREPAARRISVVHELLDAAYGLALLLQSEDAAALARLRTAVRDMVDGDRMLELPAAAVHLAEAEWRAGNEEEADRAADVALAAARRIGSNHVLLQALAGFPAVLSRRIDAERAADSPWHELGRALGAQGVVSGAPAGTTVVLREFGACAIVAGGQEARPRITKTYELLAYLTVNGRAEREQLLDALFDGRADDSARSYLRQAVRWLRQALPGDDDLAVDHGVIALGPHVRVRSESQQFESAVAEAARLHGVERLDATVAALALFDRGEYLPGTRSRWVDERRERLAQQATDARAEAAELAFAAGRLDDARRLADEVLGADEFRESAWRLRMRIANALGDDDAVIRAYKECERALGAIGAAPAPTTRELLGRLRR